MSAAPAPSPTEQAVIDRFGIFDEERAADPLALLDQLDELRAAATPGEWYQARRIHLFSDATSHPGIGETYMPADAALIVAAVNALPRLIAAVRAGLALANELDREAAERDHIAERLPNTPSYHMEINRLSVAANHQARAARQFRATLAAPLAGQHTTGEETDRG